MARRVARLTLDTLADLPAQARACVYWELDPVARARAERDGTAEAKKEAWLATVLLEWGSCGRVVYVDERPAAFVVYAPPGYFAGSAVMPTSPVSEDAIHLATAEVFAEHRGGGLGRLLMQLVVKDLIDRDLRAVEAVEAFGVFGRPPEGCALPAGFLQAVGFKTQRTHARYPRLRLELRSAVTWRSEMEAALTRLLEVVRPGRAAPAAQRRESGQPM